MLLTGCGQESRTEEASGPTPPDSLEVVEMFNLYIQGDYAAYVDMMESMDDKTDDYRTQMAALLKQRHRSQEEAHGGPIQARLLRFETNKDGNYAQAFIEVVYQDRNFDEILLPIVWKDGRWRIR